MLQFIFLMAPPAGKEANPIMQFLPIILIGVVFYFFMIRPQLKKAKNERKFKEGLNKGDKVVTIGGIHGKIIEVQDRTFTIEAEGSPQVRLKVERTAVSMEATQTIQKG